MGVKERRELEKQTRRNQILDAARKLLLSQGIEKISIGKIAKEAELGVGTIYFYYKNKEDIFVALQEEGIALLFDDIQKIAARTIEPDQKLRNIAYAYHDFAGTQKEYFNIINYFLSSSKVFFQEDVKLRIDMSAGKILSIIQMVIVAGKKAGCFADEDPEKFSIMFWGTIHGLLQFKKLERTILQNQVYMEIFEYSVEKLIQGIVLKYIGEGGGDDGFDSKIKQGPWGMLAGRTTAKILAGDQYLRSLNSGVV